MRIRVYTILALSSFLAGCSSSHGSGSKVTGIVTYNGTPVSGAKVVFCDGKETSMPSGPTAVTDESGKYALVNVPPGAYKIVVYKLVPKKGAVLPDDMDMVQIETSGMGKNALPKKYASASTTTAVASVESGSNEIDVKLDGKVDP